MVRTLVTDHLSLLAQAVSGAVLVVVLGMTLSRRLGLVAISLQPFINGAFHMKAITMRTMSKKIQKPQKKSSQLASEAVANQRIVTAFYSQKKVLKLFELAQISSKKGSQKQSWHAGFGLFIAQFLSAANAALMFWRIIAEPGSMTADLSKGTSALKSVFRILKRESKMNSYCEDGINPEKIRGDIEFREVHFFYPTRAVQMILKGLNLKIDAGNVVAVVGQSGSGKSTIIRLIERFYDTSNGLVEIDGIDIKCYNLRTLRSHMALVMIVSFQTEILSKFLC
ncbi:ABC transporter B family member 15-like [Hevea brasiliensis]|uniref:ABC transporter B family member 15-like n=1 Tax=Hevea brasiliensis TaxID=3981 RepID=UPI0025F6B2D8|nr:ABC transporter B family member 15-like [Hevea brasiliensis]